MSHLKKYLIVSIVLQLAMVIAGHFSPAILGLSAVLGMGIPFVVGAWYGATAASSYKSASIDGFLIGIIGAFIGVVGAILLGDAEWMLLTFAPLSSGVTGLLGAVILFAIAGKK